jgi:hypothetical protein
VIREAAGLVAKRNDKYLICNHLHASWPFAP